MPGEQLPNGDGTTTGFTPASTYFNVQIFAGGLFQPPANYTYVPSAVPPLNFLPAAFPFSPTPGAPGLGDSVFIFGDLAPVTSTGAGNISTGRSYTSDELIKSVQQRAQIALAARDFGPVQILRLFNEEIDGYLVPFVAQRKLEFWVESATVNVVSGTSIYAIPSVALGGKLRAMALLQGGVPFRLDQMDFSEAVQVQGQQLSGMPPSRYYFMGNSFVLIPSPAGNAQVIVYYYRRPGQLVLPSQCLQITGFPGGAAPGNYRLSYAGALPSAYAVGVAVDIISNVPNFNLYAAAPIISATGAGTLDVVGTLPVGLAAGDWISLAGTTPVITGSPADLVNLIVQEVALKVAEAKGSAGTIAALGVGLKRAEASAAWTVQQRNDGAGRKMSAFPEDSVGIGWPYR
jgi:hypothetical protein